ncbi:MAG: hypothetical protein PHR06_09235 [Candidatus Cloacimonetes bacterium]|nr:hypothetical protein [Candidatus Cloacimonadota bacterium]
MFRKNRLLIILISICFISFLNSLSFRNESSVKSLVTKASVKGNRKKDKANTVFSSKILADHKINNFAFYLFDEIHLKEKSKQSLVDPAFNYFRAKLEYISAENYIKLESSNRYYFSDNSNLIQIVGTDQIVNQRYVQNTKIQSRNQLDSFSFEGYLNLRNLGYKSETSSMDNDLYAQIRAGYKLTGKINFYVLGNHKNDLNEESYLNHNQYGMLLDYHHRIDFFNIISGSFSYYYNDSESLDPLLKHYFTTKIRYVKRIGNNYSGFISLISNSCYDENNAKLYRISNLLRISAKYSYLTNFLKDSYLMTGVKFSPENETSSVFLENNQKLWNQLYLNTKADICFEYFYKYEAGLEFLSSDRYSFQIRYQYLDLLDVMTQNAFSLGTTIFF